MIQMNNKTYDGKIARPADVERVINPETILRIQRHERDFLIVSNTPVQDKRLTWEARGLLVYLLSLPSDWEIRVSHLQKQGGKRKDGENQGTGRDALRRMLRELQEFGYASGVGRERQERGERGRFGQTEIRVYELPALNPFYTEVELPSPENPSTVDRPSAVSPSTDLPSPENPSPYKGHSPQKTQETKSHTQHKHLRAADTSAPAVVVGVNSKFSLKDCRRYADHLHASGQGVRNPGGFARAIHQTGSEDEAISAWLAEVEPERVQSGELPEPMRIDAAACPDCAGVGYNYPDPQNPAKGVAKCRHPRLMKVA
jgi:hypothetical protein